MKAEETAPDRCFDGLLQRHPRGSVVPARNQRGFIRKARSCRHEANAGSSERLSCAGTERTRIFDGPSALGNRRMPLLATPPASWTSPLHVPGKQRGVTVRVSEVFSLKLSPGFSIAINCTFSTRIRMGSSNGMSSTRCSTSKHSRVSAHLQSSLKHKKQHAVLTGG